MHWILQSNFCDEPKWRDMIATLDKFAIPYTIHKVVPFVGELVPPATPSQSNVICFGSYSMRRAAAANKWSPGVFDLESQDFAVQHQHWGDRMLNANSVVLPFSEIKFPTGKDVMFLRPTKDSKVFSGGIFGREEFELWQHKVVDLKEDYGDSLSESTMVQMNEPIKILAEYRYWIVKGQIVTKSQYKIGPRIVYGDVVDPEIDEYVQQCIDIWQPHDAFVIDVCRIDTDAGVEMRIVEINTLNAAGFYAADTQQLVFALEDAFNVQ